MIDTFRQMLNRFPIGGFSIIQIPFNGTFIFYLVRNKYLCHTIIPITRLLLVHVGMNTGVLHTGNNQMQGLGGWTTIIRSIFIDIGATL